MWGVILPSDFKPIWRVILVLCCSQLTGGFIGVCFLAKSPFLAFWCGAALAMPVGFLLGLIWHCWTSSKGRTDWCLVAFVGLLAVNMAVWGYITLVTTDADGQLSQDDWAPTASMRLPTSWRR